MKDYFSNYVKFYILSQSIFSSSPYDLEVVVSTNRNICKSSDNCQWDMFYSCDMMNSDCFYIIKYLCQCHSYSILYSLARSIHKFISELIKKELKVCLFSTAILAIQNKCIYTLYNVHKIFFTQNLENHKNIHTTTFVKSYMVLKISNYNYTKYFYHELLLFGIEKNVDSVNKNFNEQFNISNKFFKYFVRKSKVAIIFMKNDACKIQTINLNKRNCLIKLYSYIAILLSFAINITYFSRLSTFEKKILKIMPKSKIVVPIFLVSQNICLSQYYKVIYIKLLSWVK